MASQLEEDSRFQQHGKLGPNPSKLLVLAPSDSVTRVPGFCFRSKLSNPENVLSVDTLLRVL
jgi:hypothetical protein